MRVFTESTFQYLFCSTSGPISYSAVANPKAFPPCTKRFGDYQSVVFALSISLQREGSVAQQVALLHTQHIPAVAGSDECWAGPGAGNGCPFPTRWEEETFCQHLGTAVPHPHMNPNFTES